MQNKVRTREDVVSASHTKLQRNHSLSKHGHLINMTMQEIFLLVNSQKLLEEVVWDALDVLISKEQINLEGAKLSHVQIHWNILLKMVRNRDYV